MPKVCVWKQIGCVKYKHEGDITPINYTYMYMTY